MAKNKNKKTAREMATEILELVGGKENVATHINCITRLRVTPVDESKIDFDGLEQLSYVMRVQVVGGITQIVLGPGTVNEVEAEFRQLRGETAPPTDQPDSPKQDWKGTVLTFIQKTMMPILPALIGGSMMVAIVTIFNMFGIQADKETHTLLYMLNDIGNLVTSFIGVFVAISATKAMNSKSYIPVIFALYLYIGDFTDVAFGPIKLSQGMGGMICVVIMTIIIVLIENQVRKYMPKMIATVMVPVVTILISMMAFIFIAAPFANILTAFITWLFGLVINGGPVVYILGHGLVAALWPLLVVSGTHGAIWALTMPMIETIGYLPLMSAGMLFTANIAGAAIGSAIKYRKNSEEMETAVSTTITAFFGVTEPAIYGVLLPKGKNFFLTMISGAIGGLIVGVLQISIGIGGLGIFCILSVTDPATMMLPYALVYFATAAMAAILIVIFGTKPKDLQK